MTDKLKLLQCAPKRVSSAATTGQAATHLPTEMMSDQARRVLVFTAVAGGLWAYVALQNLLIIPAVLPTLSEHGLYQRALPIEVSAAVLSALTWIVLRVSRSTDQVESVIGLAFMVANAIAIALLNNLIAPPPPLPTIYVSWIAILILTFSIIAPATPWMLPATLVAASMDPLAAWAASVWGVPTPPAPQVVLQYVPNVVAAFIAVIPVHIMHGVGHRLREAQELGSYQLVELLGQGGMGEVWRAKHRLLARDAAIKIVRPEVLGHGDAAQGGRMLRRFEREAQATAALSSPHTIRVFDFGITNEGTFYYVMELLTGRDLESLVKEFGPVPAGRAVMLLRQACHSLADAHARGMVHRDIKPANIYVCRMGLEYDFVKVLDFGLVKISDRARTAQTLVTLEHTTTGTPAYMAPEIALGETEVDRRADVYALGCVAYHLLTGQLVFEGDTPMKMMMQHIEAVPIPPSQRTELPIPPDLDDVVLACLRKNPRDRPQDAGELFRRLAGVTSRDAWTDEAARSWWELHLPEMTRPLVLSESETDATTADTFSVVP